MKPSEVIAMLQTAIEQNFPVYVKGAPGGGKTSCAKAAARSPLTIDGKHYPKGIAYVLAHPCVEDVTDKKGLPGIVNGHAEFLPYGDLRQMMETTEPLLVIADDFPQAVPAVQAPWMQLLLEREIAGKKISPHVRFVLLGNRSTDNAGANKVLSTIVSRVFTTVEMAIDLAEFRKFGVANGFPVELLAFVNLRPALLDPFSSADENLRNAAKKAMKEGNPFACPRTVEFLAKWLRAGMTNAEVFCGCVGEAFATEFLGFAALFKATRGGNLPAQICSNPLGAAILEKTEEAFAIAAAMSYHATRANIDNVSAYFSRAEMEPEMRAFFWQAATASKPELVETQAFTNYTIKHSNELQ